MSYFEPNSAPEDVINGKQDKKIIIRFKSQKEVSDFTKKTGISLMSGKINRIKFPLTSSLDDFI